MLRLILSPIHEACINLEANKGAVGGGGGEKEGPEPKQVSKALYAQGTLVRGCDVCLEEFVALQVHVCRYTVYVYTYIRYTCIRIHVYTCTRVYEYTCTRYTKYGTLLRGCDVCLVEEEDSWYSHSLTHSLTSTHSPTLSLSHTHTHTHTCWWHQRA